MQHYRATPRTTRVLLAGLCVTISLVVGTLDVRVGARPLAAQDVGDAALRLTATSMAATIEALSAVVTEAARATHVAELQQHSAELIAGQTATAAAAAPQATATLTPISTVAPTRAATPIATGAAPIQPRAPTAQAKIQARGIESLVAGLNIRSGPGTGYEVISSANYGQFFNVTGKVANCAWLRIDLGLATDAWVTGSSNYVRLTLDCDDVPLVEVASPLAAAMPLAPVATATPAAPVARVTVAPIANAVEATAEATATLPLQAIKGQIALSRANSSGMDVWVYDLGSLRVVAQVTNACQPDLSQRVLLLNGEGGKYSSVFRVGLDGDVKQPITANAEDSYPQWSPSMASIAYASRKGGDQRSRIYFQEDATAQVDVEPLSYNGNDIFGNYTVYLDNWRIAYNGCDTWQGGSRCGIYTIDTRGSEPLRATDGADDVPTGSLGSQVLFTSRRNGSFDVWIANWDGSGMRALTDNPTNDGLAVGSPDGKLIAFISDRDGAWGVWLMEPDGSSQRKLFTMDGGYTAEGYDWTSERISWGW